MLKISATQEARLSESQYDSFIDDKLLRLEELYPGIYKNYKKATIQMRITEVVHWALKHRIRTLCHLSDVVHFEIISGFVSTVNSDEQFMKNFSHNRNDEQDRIILLREYVLQRIKKKTK